MLHQQDLVKGASLIVLSEFFFVTMGALVKAASAGMSSETIVLFRNLFGLAALVPILWHNGARSLSTRVLPLHLLRGVAGVSAMYCFFYALAHLPLADAILLKLTAPLFIPFIAWAWLSESVPRSTRWAIVIGFCGVILILDPTVALHPAAVIGLAGGLLAALAKVTVRRLSISEPTSRTVFYFGIVATLVSAPPALWNWHTPTAHEWGLLIALGTVATLGQLALTRGYSLARAGQIGGFTYVSVLLGAIFGWVFWQEVMSLNAILGAALIVLSGLMILAYGKTSKLRSAVLDTS